MEYTNLLQQRRSTRSFTGEPVSRAELDAMLAAGVRAPNACNAQSWHFFCTIDRQVISGMVPKAAKQEFVRDAGCVILVCTDPAALEARFGSIVRELFSIQDTAAAATQILQYATTLGLAGCWIGSFDRIGVRDFFSVPDTMEPVILLAIGHAKVMPELRERKPMEEVVTLLGDCGE